MKNSDIFVAVIREPSFMSKSPIFGKPIGEYLADEIAAFPHAVFDCEKRVTRPKCMFFCLLYADMALVTEDMIVGAAEALKLLRNAEKVSSFCNDVVGDICGVVSGSASAIIAVRALTQIDSDTVSQLIMSALVAGVTIAGKAFGKNLAMSNSTRIVHFASKLIYYIKSPFRFSKQRKKR